MRRDNANGTWERDRPWDLKTTGSTGVPVDSGLRSDTWDLRPGT